MQFDTQRFTVAPLPKMRLKVQSVHQHWMTDLNITARDLHRLLGMLVFMASPTRMAAFSSGPMVGRHIMVPEDRELVQPDPSSSVGSVRGGLVGISSSPARSTPRHHGAGSNSLHGCIQFGLGSPVRLTLDTGTVVSISTTMAHQRSGDAGRHLCRERLPTSSEVPDGCLMCYNAVTVAYIKNEGGTRSPLWCRWPYDCWSGATARQLCWFPSICRSAQHPGGFPVQSWPDTDHGVVRPVFAKWGEPRVDLFATFANRRLVKFVSPYPDPRAEWTDAMSMTWDNGRGLLYAFPPFKVVPQVLQKIAQSPGVKVILIAQLQPAASWFPELMNLHQEDPILLYVEGQDLLTQDVWTGDGVTETRHFRPSNLHAWKLCGPSWGRRAIPGKLPTWCQGAFGNLHGKYTKSHWSRFVAFCRTKRWHMFRVRSHHFSTYMVHLFRDGHLPSTIISHPRSVASVLRHWVYDPAADPHIKLLVRAFRLERPVQRRIMPMWDLHLVLLSLLRLPFTFDSDEYGESSDDVIPLKWRTLKCVFLLALVSARRRSYLQALSIAPARCVFARGNTQRQLVVRISYRHRPLNGLWCPGLPTWFGRNRRECYVPLDSWSSKYRTLKESVGGGGGGGASAYVHTLEPQHQGYHEEPHKPIDLGDLSRKPTLKLIEYDCVTHMRSEPFQLHGRTTVRWPFLTSCQQRFGGLLGFSRIHIFAT